MHFENAKIEKEFEELFNQRALSLDKLYSVLVAPQGLLAVFWYNPGFTPRQALSLAVWGVVYNAVGASVMYAQWFKPQSYLRNRTAWVVGVRTIRLLAALVFLVPLERGAVPAGSRLPLLSGWLRGGAVLSVLQAFGYQLPLRLHVWVGGLSILGIAAFSHARCGAELGAVGGMAGRYGALAGQLSRMGRLDVTSHGTRHAALPSDLEACWLANTYAMVVLGFVMPTCILAVREERWRQRFLMRRGGPFLLPSQAALVLGHSATGAIMCLLAWLSCVAALQLWRLVAPV